MLPSLPFAAALLDQYALLTAAALTKQQQQANSAQQQHQQDTALALEALWPSLLYGRLLAANSSASLSPPTPPANPPKSKKYRGFSVKDLLDVEETPEPAAAPTSGESVAAAPLSPPSPKVSNKQASSETTSPAVTSSTASSVTPSLLSTSPSASKWLGSTHGPLDELCKLASRPIVEDNVHPSQTASQFLVSHLMLPSAGASISRAIGEFGSCPNLDQASSSNFAALLHQQQRFRQAAALTAAASAGNPGHDQNSTGGHHHHRFHKPLAHTGSLNNVSIHSLGLVRRKRKTRTSFTPHQIAELEKRFFKQKYLTSSDRDDLASTLNLTAGQVITWFQNRRAKLKRDIEEIKGDIKMEGNNNSCGSLSSETPPSPGDSFAEEDEMMDGDDDDATKRLAFAKSLHAVSEPSIHHLVTAGQFQKKQ